MSIQDILAALQAQGFNTQGGFQGMSADTIMTGAGTAAGLTGPQISGENALLNSQMFAMMPESLLKSSSLSAYSPLFQQKQSSLIPQLIAQMGGQQAKKAHGGFAGSGGAMAQQTGARDVYGGAMGDVFGQAMTGKTQSIGQVQNWVDNWLETAQQFAG